MVLFTSGSPPAWGKSQKAFLPGICLPHINNKWPFALYRDFNMSEFEFFMEREDRWGNSLKALWGSLSICPMVTCIRLPLHTAEELDSIRHLKVWGNAQMPHPNRAYLLVWVDDTPNAKTYGLALVWVNPLQTRAVAMADALDILATFAYEGPDWPYILIQLHEGAKHMPLPANKHLGVLAQEKMEGPSGQISQLKIHQLLCTRLLVVVPVELNGGEQAVTVNLLEPLCTGSSITSDDHPFVEVNIPSPTMEDQGCMTPTQGGHQDTLPTTIPKTPWKPRIALAT